METVFVHIQQTDGYQTRLFCYETSADNILGSILILHGMTEHHERYLPFIQLLTQEGFDVYAYDHRGHGTDKKLSELGFISEKNGASLLISDAVTICQYIKSNGRSEKLAVYGHSMGSMVTRCLAQQYHELNCIIVSSTDVTPLLKANLGQFLCAAVCLFRGKRKKSTFLNNCLFGGKQYSSLCSRTKFDWLTRNNTAVGKYISDPYCGFTCATSFYLDLIHLTKRASRRRNIVKADRNLPILFLAGDKDPVNHYSKDVIRLLKIHDNLGFTDVALLIYPEARHELLNEINAEEVMLDAAEFFHRHLG